MLSNYTQRLEQHLATLTALQTRNNILAGLRLLSALLFAGALYVCFKTGSGYAAALSAVCFALFIVLVRLHQKNSAAKALHTALVQVNADEIAYLKGEELPFDNGIGYQQIHHAYAYDLDFFGDNSLYQHLNRTATVAGQAQLASNLCRLLPPEEILSHQDAVRELTGKTDWRQEVYALARIQPDSRRGYEQLLLWAERDTAPLPLWVRTAAVALPVAFGITCLLAFLTRVPVYANLASGLFTMNLFLLFSQQKTIRREIAQFDRVHTLLKQYAGILSKIEQETFESALLKNIQTALGRDTAAASRHIRRLSVLFDRMDSVQNLMAVVFFDGTFLYHLHALHALLQWKRAHGAHIRQWLSLIGQVEALNSIANFAANNPAFAYPELNNRQHIVFSGLGHPLIKASKRVCNDVAFVQQKFIVLTGSNMSGKSTFLRTLGVNMVLSGMGAPVCATRAQVHPMPVLVSMRLSDSLSDAESYFFAEVKRLHDIMLQLDQQTTFVLLDEILRGTNSDDKRFGTIAVLKKMVEKGAIGALATHDLEVCHTTADYPDYLTNKCFEVDISGSELAFDYRLRDGICQNKSASFLMAKMGVI